jgi:hypothetical protein
MKKVFLQRKGNKKISITKGHHLFSHISINWCGKPLTSLAVIISLINATTTKTGLKVTAKLDDTVHKTGIKISDGEFEKINIKRYKFHGEWNYYSTKFEDLIY